MVSLPNLAWNLRGRGITNHHLRHDTLDIHSIEHSTVDTAHIGDITYAICKVKSRPYCGSTWAQHEQCGTAEGTGYTAGTGHTAQPHGAHSQEWPGPHGDPHTVGNGFGNGKLLATGRSVFLPYGCRTGRATVKYPGYRKNAQRNITHPMPAPRPCRVLR